ncbi:MAG: TRAP transporter substrate-binding protein DctP [Desulfatibacillaceae bacterium]
MKHWPVLRHAVILAACMLLAALAAGVAAAAEEGVTWKFATLAPKSVGYAVNVREVLAPALAEATDGRLHLKVYYGGIMGNDDDYVRKMSVGQLQGAGLTLVGANMISPDFSVLALPFLFRDFAEVDHVRDRLYREFDKSFRERGFKLVLWLDQDFDLFYSRKWRLDNFRDFARAKVLTWSGPIEQTWMRALGISPIDLGVVEAPAAIRTGVADTNITTSIWQVGTQLHTITKYVNLTKMRYSPAAVVVTEKAWDMLDPGHQKAVMNMRPELERRFNRATRKDSRRCLDGMIRYGVTPVTTSDGFRQKMEARCLPVHDELAGSVYDRDLLELVRRTLEEYRSGSAEDGADR